MDNMKNMQQNKLADEDLDQITGGRNIFNIFTTEFRGKTGKPNTLEMILEGDENSTDCSAGTLEMRKNPLDSREENDRKVVKL